MPRKIKALAARAQPVGNFNKLFTSINFNNSAH
jgi:hypothetical protein